MFSSKLRVVVGTAAAVGALSITGVATATFIQPPGGGTTPQPIKTNPTMPKSVAVGVAFGGPEKLDVCATDEAQLTDDLGRYWRAKDPITKTAAKIDHESDLDAALNDGCFVQEL
jgi:hypothetical protein